MRAGWASNDITPDTACSLLGYDFRQQYLPAGNDGAIDPLLCRALVLADEAGAISAIWVSLDLCIISVGFARGLRQLIAADHGIGRERVLVSCSHTHSGPWLVEPELTDAVGQVFDHVDHLDADGPEAAYARALPAVIQATVQQAAGLCHPVSMHVHEGPLGLGYQRRVPSDDGVAMCWNPQEQDHLQPAAAIDPTMTVIEWRQQQGDRRLVMLNVGCHPVTLGKTSRVVSADWPGRAMHGLEDLVPGCQAQFSLGPCGDVHPWLATQDRAAALDQVGLPVASTAALWLAAMGPGLTAPAWSAVERTIELGGADLDLVVWRYGALTIAAAPVELFAGLGLALRERIAGPVLIATNTNGWTGYWPDEPAFAQGDYEINAALANGRSAGDGERLIELLLEMADSR